MADVTAVVELANAAAFATRTIGEVVDLTGGYDVPDAEVAERVQKIIARAVGIASLSDDPSPELIATGSQAVSVMGAMIQDARSGNPGAGAWVRRFVNQTDKTLSAAIASVAAPNTLTAAAILRGYRADALESLFVDNAAPANDRVAELEARIEELRASQDDAVNLANRAGKLEEDLAQAQRKLDETQIKMQRAADSQMAEIEHLQNQLRRCDRERAEAIASAEGEAAAAQARREAEDKEREAAAIQANLAADQEDAENDFADAVSAISEAESEADHVDDGAQAAADEATGTTYGAPGSKPAAEDVFQQLKTNSVDGVESVWDLVGRNWDPRFEAAYSDFIDDFPRSTFVDASTFASLKGDGIFSSVVEFIRRAITNDKMKTLNTAFLNVGTTGAPSEAKRLFARAAYEELPAAYATVTETVAARPVAAAFTSDDILSMLIGMTIAQVEQAAVKSEKPVGSAVQKVVVATTSDGKGLTNTAWARFMYPVGKGKQGSKTRYEWTGETLTLTPGIGYWRLCILLEKVLSTFRTDEGLGLVAYDGRDYLALGTEPAAREALRQFWADRGADIAPHSSASFEATVPQGPALKEQFKNLVGNVTASRNVRTTMANEIMAHPDYTSEWHGKAMSLIDRVATSSTGTVSAQKLAHYSAIRTALVAPAE